MQSETVLPGLERLLEVCGRRAHPLKRKPPLSPSPEAGVPVAGLPLDPLLAALHARVGYLWVKDGFFLFPAREALRSDLVQANERWRQDWVEPFRSLLVFARDDRLAYYYATVPSLADAAGRQPVVWVDVYEDLYALPVASDVDHFLGAWARHLEVSGAAPEDEEEPVWNQAFPWRASALIARDRPLLELLHAGRFDSLMARREQAWEWKELLLGGR